MSIQNRWGRRIWFATVVIMTLVAAVTMALAQRPAAGNVADSGYPGQASGVTAEEERPATESAGQSPTLLEPGPDNLADHPGPYDIPASWHDARSAMTAAWPAPSE